MSDAANDNNEPPAAVSREFALGIANTVQASLIGVHSAFGQQIVLTGMAQYVRGGAGDGDQRAHWNMFVVEMRDAYFALADIKDDG